jgi:hypothetical protein
MGALISRQPNGKLCRFSTVVDTVTHWNMTEEEYIEMCVQRAVEEARRDAEDTLKNWMHPFEEVKKSFWPNNDTIEEFNEILHEMGDEEGLGKERENAIRAEIKRNEEEEQ